MRSDISMTQREDPRSIERLGITERKTTVGADMVNVAAWTANTNSKDGGNVGLSSCVGMTDWDICMVKRTPVISSMAGGTSGTSFPPWQKNG